MNIPSRTVRLVSERWELDTVTGCKNWTGFIGSHGYGVVSTCIEKKFVQFLAHRLAWEISEGSIPNKLCVLHKCDNPRCINVDHLFLGTQLDNISDMVKKGRHSRGVSTQKRIARLSKQEIDQIILDARPHRTVAPEYGISHNSVRLIRQRHQAQVEKQLT